MLKLASITLTNAYQNFDTILSAVSGRPFGNDRVLRNGLFTNTGAEVVTLSVGPAAGNNATSNTIPVGGSIPFEEVNLSDVCAKAASSASTIEISGDA